MVQRSERKKIPEFWMEGPAPSSRCAPSQVSSSVQYTQSDGEPLVEVFGVHPMHSKHWQYIVPLCSSLVSMSCKMELNKACYWGFSPHMGPQLVE